MTKSEWVRVDQEKLMSSLFRPGMNHVSDGLRGGGKTHHAMWMSNAVVQGIFDSIPRTTMLTNVIFLEKTAQGLREGYPPGVHHIQSMEQMFRKIGELLEKDRQAQILCVLDEAQNFLLADQNQDDVNLAFVRFYGSTRKFGLILWMLTPSINNIVPRARNFHDHPEKPGYVNVRWRKDPQRAREYVREHGLDMEPRQFITVQMGHDHEPELMTVGSSPWTTPLDELRTGGFGYDHLACADFSMGSEAFDFREFMRRCGGVPSMNLSSAILSYFDDMDCKAEEEGEEHQQALRVNRMRNLPRGKLTWDEIAYVEGVSDRTLRRRCEQAGLL